MPYHSIDEILRRCRDRACPFWQVVLTTQAKETQLPESAVLDQMDQMAKAMEDSITQYDPTAVTTGKMGGQNGARLAEYNQKGDTLLGGLPVRRDRRSGAGGREQRLYEAHCSRPHCRQLRGNSSSAHHLSETTGSAPPRTAACPAGQCRDW